METIDFAGSAEWTAEMGLRAAVVVLAEEGRREWLRWWW